MSLRNIAKAKDIRFYCQYDALGRRSSKKITQDSITEIRKYAYDNDEIIAELDGNNEILVTYTQSGLRTDDTLSMEVTLAGVSVGLAPNSGKYFFVKDGLGSVINIVNSSGIVVQHNVYSSFGKILKVENNGIDKTLNPDFKLGYGYTNREYDKESELYYYRARYYDPALGRFLQEDPHPGSLNDPGTLISKYVYVVNDPTNLVDPSGKFLMILFAIAAEGALWGAVSGFTIGLLMSNGNLSVAGTMAFQGAFIGAGAALGGTFMLTALSSGGITGASLFLGELIGAGIGGGVFGVFAGVSFEQGFIAGATGRAISNIKGFIFDSTTTPITEPPVPIPQESPKPPTVNRNFN